MATKPLLTVSKESTTVSLKQSQVEYYERAGASLTPNTIVVVPSQFAHTEKFSINGREVTGSMLFAFVLDKNKRLLEGISISVSQFRRMTFGKACEIESVQATYDDRGQVRGTIKANVSNIEGMSLKLGSHNKQLVVKQAGAYMVATGEPYCLPILEENGRDAQGNTLYDYKVDETNPEQLKLDIRVLPTLISVEVPAAYSDLKGFPDLKKFHYPITESEAEPTTKSMVKATSRRGK